EARDGQGFGLGGIDLAGHDRGPRLVFGQDKLPEPAPWARPKQANVVRNLEKAGRHGGEGAMKENLGVVGGKPLELVGGADERQSRQRGKPGGEPFRKAGGRIEAGADSGASLSDSEQVRGRLANAANPRFDLCRVAREFLPQCERDRILQMGTADLDDRYEG